jgi:hypothetical protein
VGLEKNLDKLKRKTTESTSEDDYSGPHAAMAEPLSPEEPLEAVFYWGPMVGPRFIFFQKPARTSGEAKRSGRRGERWFGRPYSRLESAPYQG